MSETTAQPAEAGTEQPATSGEAAPENTSSNDGAATQESGLGGAEPESDEKVTLGSESEGESSEAEAAETSPEGAPESYEQFTLSEDSSLDDGFINNFGEAAKAANLTQEQAQEFLAKLDSTITEAGQRRIVSLSQEWSKQVRADKEIGGPKFQENLAVANRAYEQFASQPLRELLRTTGLESHPEIVRMFFKAGQAISPDTVETEAGDSRTGEPNIVSTQSEMASRLFPSSANRKK